MQEFRAKGWNDFLNSVKSQEIENRQLDPDSEALRFAKTFQTSHQTYFYAFCVSKTLKVLFFIIIFFIYAALNTSNISRIIIQGIQNQPMAINGLLLLINFITYSYFDCLCLCSLVLLSAWACPVCLESCDCSLFLWPCVHEHYFSPVRVFVIKKNSSFIQFYCFL